MNTINRGWYRYLQSDSVIIFIHGLMSDCKKCWSNENHNFWPEMVSNDPRTNGISIYLAEYYTDITSGDFDFSECAKEVLTDLTTIDYQLRRTPISYRNIIFVGHSAGGIISRLIVESNRELFKDKKTGFFLIASPSLGSKYNILAKILIKISGHSLAKELKWNGEFLKSLDDRFRDLIERNELDICGRELYENKINFNGRLAYFNQKVVDKESARRYFGSGVMIPQSDHSSICKPNDKNHNSHKELCKFLLDKFPSETIGKTGKSFLPKIVSDPLFTQYENEHEQYFIVRKIDNELEREIDKYSMWVCGCTGVGKTVSIQRILKRRNLTFKYISMARSVNENVTQILNDLLDQLNDYKQINKISKSHTLKLISEKVEELSCNGYSALFIEEIPIKNENEFIEFSESILSIISSINTNNNNCRLIISSIFFPQIFKDSEFEKHSEKIKIFTVEKWSNEELRLLSMVIEKGMGLSLLTMNKQYDAFNGSPRAIKAYYTDYVFNERAS